MGLRSASNFPIVAIVIAALTSPALGRQSDSDISFGVTPYAWFTSANATAVHPGDGAAIGLNVDRFDLLKNFKLGGMIALEARYRKFNIITDAAYGSFGLQGSNANPAFSNVTLGINAWMGNAYIGYEIVERRNFSLDLLAGTRFIAPDITFVIDGVETTFVKQGYFDPIIGSRFRLSVNNHILLHVVGDVGGFGAASDHTWQLYGGLDASITDTISIQAGYRIIDWNFKTPGKSALREITGKGPVVGISVSF